MKNSYRILSPCGILGYGFPDESFYNGLAMKPDAIIVDAGSTDAGPHKLGANTAIVSRIAAKKDLSRIIRGGIDLNIPIIISSAGGSGGQSHVEWTLSIISELWDELDLPHTPTAIIWADIDKKTIRNEIKNHTLIPLGDSVPELTYSMLDETTGVVAQMGMEPIIAALQQDYKLIICGRAYDPAPFAAAAVVSGFDAALAYHMGKVLECGALCCDPGTTKDCMMGEIFTDWFEVYPTNPTRRCTSVSVAAHTFYEKEHPYILQGPGIILDLEHCTYQQIDNHRVRVKGSKISYTNPYQIKLEGARRVAFRTFVVAGIRDPLLISRIHEVEEEVKMSVVEQYREIDPSMYTIGFYNYGLNGVMGDLEPISIPAHELGVVFEVLAESQAIASAICASLRSTFMHHGYEGRKSTAGNLAFPFAPSDVDFGAVYEFSVYHLMQVEDPLKFFPIEPWEPKKFGVM